MYDSSATYDPMMIGGEALRINLVLYTDAFVIRGIIRTRQQRITDILNDFNFFSCSVWCRCKKASEIPAGGIVCQPLVIEVNI